MMPSLLRDNFQTFPESTDFGLPCKLAVFIEFIQIHDINSITAYRWTDFRVSVQDTLSGMYHLVCAFQRLIFLVLW